jgi:hypothetical protein
MDAVWSRLPNEARLKPRSPAATHRCATPSTAVIAAVALAITAALPGCGTNVSTPLPDVKAKSAVPEGGVKPKSAAEQKKAIDDLMAKRDAPR